MDEGHFATTPAVAVSENRRVAELHALGILDTAPQAIFDSITALCSASFACKLAGIALLDADRQWFLSTSDPLILEVPHELALRNHIIASGQPLLVTDLAADPRFPDHPMARSQNGIASYLGQPLKGPGGHCIGTLCLADPQRAKFTDAHVTQLGKLALVVEQLLLMHRSHLAISELNSELEGRSRELSNSNRIFEQAERTANIGSWHLDLV
ncbi:GAF domain-containing protein [Qipengyuania marisflavi]|uniref:GAF domain-containing protein n=1 Tax=Qipengyuania marisflavi TaxID=2486356 RepID=A0A5S3PBG2_9SPHN|nr:GAF domain-containing protein [Qipengyuania marisflavi]TMM48388.1 GAF domain-containing protein [Qipengyuania marisflavi]